MEWNFWGRQKRELRQLRDKIKQAEDQVAFLQACIDYHVEDFRNKRDLNRRWTILLKMYAILVAAGITIILGFASSPLFTGKGAWLDEKGPTYFALFALVLSATVTVVSSWEAFSGYDWKWVRYRSTLADFYQLRDDIQLRKLGGKPIESPELEGFYKRITVLLEGVNEEWANRRTLPENTPKDAPKQPTTKPKSTKPKSV